MEYKNILNSENNLTKCFINLDDCETQVENWQKEFNKILQRSFPKVRVSGKEKVTPVSILFERRTKLVQKLKIDKENKETQEEKEKVEEELAKHIAKENRDKIFESFSKLDQSEGETFCNGIWQLKKKSFPKSAPAIPSAKRDVTGRTVTDPHGLKHLYQETFSHRLRFRPPKQSVAEDYDWL